MAVSTFCSPMVMPDAPAELILASASPARHRLLKNAGIPHRVQVSGFAEDSVTAVDAEQLVKTLARGKAAVVLERLVQRGPLVLGCDSILSFGGTILGKPRSEAEAVRRWQAMAGGVGALHTGHCLVDSRSNTWRCDDVVTRVHFAAIDVETIRSYVASGEAMGAAGGFTLEGRGGLLVDALEGCTSNVMGLSLPWLRCNLNALGVTLAELWPT